MPKRKLDSSIISSIRVAASGSVSENIKNIDVDNLVESADNFFEINRIEELADTILGQGYVKENLIVREIGGDKYEIVSGHRRTAAVRLLLERGAAISRALPCLVQEYDSDADKNLDIVLMNVSGRRITNAEMFKSYEVINAALQKLKKDGVKFGQVQKTIAELLGISTGQVAIMQTIEKYSSDEELDAVRDGKISFSSADKKIEDKKPPKSKPKNTAKKSEPPPEKVSTNDNFSEGFDEEFDEEFDEISDIEEIKSEVKAEVKNEPPAKREPDNIADYFAEHCEVLSTIFDAYFDLTDSAEIKAVIAGIKRFL
jgi:hypothetical protein